MIGKRRRVARDKLLVSLLGVLPPLIGLVPQAGFNKHSRELRRVIGVVGVEGEAAKPSDRAVPVA